MLINVFFLFFLFSKDRDEYDSVRFIAHRLDTIKKIVDRYENGIKDNPAMKIVEIQKYMLEANVRLKLFLSLLKNWLLEFWHLYLQEIIKEKEKNIKDAAENSFEKPGDSVYWSRLFGYREYYNLKSDDIGRALKALTSHLLDLNWIISWKINFTEKIKWCVLFEIFFRELFFLPLRS